MAEVTPTNSSGIADVQAMRGCDTFSSQFVCDRIVKELVNFSVGLQNATGPANLLGHGTGTPALAELASSECCAFTLDANNESVGYLWALPQGIDLAQSIDFRAVWSNSAAAGTGSALFAFLYTPLTLETTAVAIGATALDTVIASDVDLGAEILAGTAWGSIAASTLTGTPCDDRLATKMQVTLTTITDASLFAIDVRYYRRFIGG